MGNVAEAVTVAFAAVMAAAIAFEIKRRRARLRELYDVLDKDTRHIAQELEGMVQSQQLQPYTGNSMAW